MTGTYEDFLSAKAPRDPATGIDDHGPLNRRLFGYQRDITSWALRRGRAAIFADCGLGKTPQQLEWARHVHVETKRPVMIFAPLAVKEQTVREGVKFGVEVNPCREQSEIVNPRQQVGPRNSCRQRSQ